MFFSTQVFGSLLEDESLVDNISASYEPNEDELLSPRRLSPSAMYKLRKAARALSISVGDNSNEQQEENGHVFNTVDDPVPEEFEAESEVTGRERSWAVLEASTSRNDCGSEPATRDAVLETKGESTANFKTVIETEERVVVADEIESLSVSESEQKPSRETSEEREQSQGDAVTDLLKGVVL